MKALEDLIEKYKNKLEDTNYTIWCDRKNYQTRYNKYDFDYILEKFISDITGFKIEDFSYKIRDPKGIIVKYSVSNEEFDIMLCRRRINFDISKKFKKIKHTDHKSFLFIPYKDTWEEKVEAPDSLTHDNLLLEIDEDTYKELEQFTLKALKDRSVNKILEIK